MHYKIYTTNIKYKCAVQTKLVVSKISVHAVFISPMVITFLFFQELPHAFFSLLKYVLKYYSLFDILNEIEEFSKDDNFSIKLCLD